MGWIKKNFLLFFLTLLILLQGFIISEFTKDIQYDQKIALYQLDNYPLIDSGISSHLIIGLYNWIVNPEVGVRNIHIKSLVMVLYMVACFLLISSFLKKFREKFLAITLICFSGFPLLWLSTELIVGSFLALTLWAIIDGKKPYYVGILIVLMGFSKPDMMLISGVIAIYYIWKYLDNRSQIYYFGLTLALTGILIVLPGFSEYGKDYLKGQNRAYYSFGQHYAVIFEKHQIEDPVPSPWEDYSKYMRGAFPEAGNFGEILIKYPRKYLEFVVLSVFYGILKFLKLFHVLVALFFLLLFFMFRTRKKWCFSNGEKLILLSFTGILPMCLFAFPHIRYFAKYYPLIIIMVILFTEKLSAYGYARIKKYSSVIMILYFIISVMLFFKGIFLTDNIKDFWFPD